MHTPIWIVSGDITKADTVMYTHATGATVRRVGKRWVLRSTLSGEHTLTSKARLDHAEAILANDAKLAVTFAAFSDYARMVISLSEVAS